MAEIIPDYTVHIGDQSGNRLDTITDFLNFQITLRVNGPHIAQLTLPVIDGEGAEFPQGYVGEDFWFEFWRGTTNRRLVGASPFLMQIDEYEERDTGEQTIKVRGYSGSYVATWPIVAADTESAEAKKTEAADDMIKTIADEQIGGSAADTDRDMSAMLSIEADKSDGVSVTKSFSRRKLDKIFTQLCEQSAKLGTRLYWDIIDPSPGSVTSRSLELRTYTGQRGDNRGIGQDRELIFSVDRGNLQSLRVINNYENVVNYAYGLGQGLKGDRNVQEAEDAARVASSPWGRIKEGTRQAQSDTDAAVTAEAQSLLRQARPKRTVEARIQNIPGTEFMKDWNFGDLVVIETKRHGRFEAIINSVQIWYSPGRAETITANLRVEE